MPKSDNYSWEPVILAEGAKGPLVAEVARTRVFPSKDGIPQENSVWLFMRRMTDGQIKYAFSNAPEETSIEIVRYYTRRNHVAYLSHRKKALRRAAELNLKVPL